MGSRRPLRLGKLSPPTHTVSRLMLTCSQCYRPVADGRAITGPREQSDDIDFVRFDSFSPFLSLSFVQAAFLGGSAGVGVDARWIWFVFLPPSSYTYPPTLHDSPPSFVSQADRRKPRCPRTFCSLHTTSRLPPSCPFASSMYLYGLFLPSAYPLFLIPRRSESTGLDRNKGIRQGKDVWA